MSEANCAISRQPAISSEPAKNELSESLSFTIRNEPRDRQRADEERVMRIAEFLHQSLSFPIRGVRGE